jgi:hypothetical protein
MDLEQRLARLERGNRRMKRIGVLGLVVAAAVLLSGQAKGKDLQDLVVGSLTLKDKDGKTRAQLHVDEDGSASLLFRDKDGKTRALLSVLANGPPGLYLYDKYGRARAALYVDAGVPVLNLSDKGGRTRAALGVTTTVDKRTGAETKTTESTLTLFDAMGNVIWKAPR